MIAETSRLANLKTFYAFLKWAILNAAHKSAQHDAIMEQQWTVL